MNLSRRAFVATALAFGAMAAAGGASAADYPDRTITMVVPFSPGGNVDATARIVSLALGGALGQPVVILNRPGAGGATGAAYVAKSEPNGYTLLFTVPDTLTIVPRMVRTPYQLSDFQAIGSVATTTPLLVVGKDSRFKTIKDFVAAAKAQPGVITIGHAGVGSTSQLALLQFAKAANIQLNLVPYPGSAPALVDLIGGQIDSAVDQMTSSLPHLKAGGLRALAVMSQSRNTLLPDVSTLHEAGIGFDLVTTVGIYAPAGTPGAIVEKLHTVLNKVLSDDSIKSQLEVLGSFASATSIADFNRQLLAEDTRAQGLLDNGMLAEK